MNKNIVNHFFMDPEEIRAYCEKINDEVITLAVTAEAYYRLYYSLQRAIELECGSEVAAKVRKASTLFEFDKISQRIKEEKKKEGDNNA